MVTTSVRKAGPALIAIALATAFSSSALAEDFKVRKLKFTNKGAYGACVFVRWRSLGTRVARGIGCPDSGVSVSADLTNDKFDLLEKDDEVWLSVQIQGGEMESCRKDKTKFIYDPEGGVAAFKTGGTTWQYNRCKIVCKQCKE